MSFHDPLGMASALTDQDVILMSVAEKPLRSPVCLLKTPRFVNSPGPFL